MSFNLGTVLTDAAQAAQVGFGIYSETQGTGGPVNTNIGGVYTAGSSVAGSAPGSALTKTYLGFTAGEIVIGVIAILAVLFAIWKFA